MIGLLHNYSRTNPGDGLLTDLTLSRLNRVGVGREDVLLVALDPDSFSEFPHRLRMGARGRGLAPELIPAIVRAAALGASGLTGKRVGQTGRKLAECSGIVGVGGGYLRSVDLVSSVGTLLNHLPQLLFADATSIPSLYLPQTIGPLRGPVGKSVLRGIQRVDAVCVRDPSSQAELAGLPNVRHVPDLAVLNVAETWDQIEKADSGGQVGMVAAQMPHAAGYDRHLLRLARRLGDRATWLLHKTGHPTKSDAVIYERLGIAAGGELAGMLQERRLSVVISVRLHGALIALAAGVPAIHIAYDRKGPGAFGDLGLDEWCFDIRSLDGLALNAAVDKLLSDPAPYWSRVANRVPALREASAALDGLVHRILG